MGDRTHPPLHELNLYWVNTDRTGEIDLGSCWHHLIPRVGEILTHHHPAHPGGVVWEVVQVYYGTVEQGSRTWTQWFNGQPHPGGQIDLFVRPTTGPHLP